MPKQVKGKISVWNDGRGFGFITPASGGDRVFVHIKAIKNRQSRPQLNQTVFYTPSQDKDGRPLAENVSYTARASGGVTGSAGAFVLTGLFFTALGILTFIIRIVPPFIIALYAIASVITYLAYAADKKAARTRQWRTSEGMLHALSLCGGWPGALIAQKTLHHKSRKRSFLWMYKFTVVLNVAVTAWLLTPRGPELTMAWLEKISQ